MLYPTSFYFPHSPFITLIAVLLAVASEPRLKFLSPLSLSPQLPPPLPPNNPPPATPLITSIWLWLHWEGKIVLASLQPAREAHKYPNSNAFLPSKIHHKTTTNMLHAHYCTTLQWP